MTTLLMLAATATAADNEIALELGTIYSDDRSWDAFSSDDVLPSKGLRVGFGVADDVAVIGSYGYGARGADVDLWSTDGEGWFSTAFYGHQLGLGAKVTPLDWRYLRPYVAPQAVALYGVARLDEDTGDDDNLNQIQAAGTAFGGVLNGGLELVLADERRKVVPAAYIELGYGWLTSMQLDDLGDVQFKGLTSRFGLGVHF